MLLLHIDVIANSIAPYLPMPVLMSHNNNKEVVSNEVKTSGSIGGCFRKFVENGIKDISMQS